MFYIANAIVALLGLCVVVAAVMLWRRDRQDPFLNSAEARELRRALHEFMMAVGNELKPPVERLLKILRGLGL